MIGTTTDAVCKLPGCRDTFSRSGGPGRPRDYCDRHSDPKHPDRTAERKALERARLENALMLVEGEFDAPSKRVTSMPREDGDRDEDWSYGLAGLWDEIAACWRYGRLHRVDWLMAEAERSSGQRRFKRKCRGENTPPVPARSYWHVTSARRLRPDFEDRNCPGELWLRGEHEVAEERAQRAARYVKVLSDSQPDEAPETDDRPKIPDPVQVSAGEL